MRRIHKTLLLILSCVVAVSVFTAPVFAQSQSTEMQRFIDEQRVATLRDRGLAEVEGRIGYFGVLIAMLEKMERVQPAQKAMLLSQLKIYVADLGSIKTKLKQDTQVSEVVRERQAIAKTYNAYRFLMPKVRMMFFAEQAIELIEEMKPRISDPASISNLNNAANRSESLLATVGSLPLEGYPANRDELLKARQSIKFILEDIKGAWQWVR